MQTPLKPPKYIFKLEITVCFNWPSRRVLAANKKQLVFGLLKLCFIQLLALVPALRAALSQQINL